MYIGAKSLTGLWFFLNGVEIAKDRYFIKSKSEVPWQFADWAAYRLHLDSNCSGFWHRIILSRIRDEELAFDRFYELRDEFIQRQARVVASIREDSREYKVGRIGANGETVWSTEFLPKSLRIVVYTDDQGFFLATDDGEDEPSFFCGGFYPALNACNPTLSDRFTPCDKVTWNRLLAENKKYKRNLSRKRARIQWNERSQDAGGPAQ